MHAMSHVIRLFALLTAGLLAAGGAQAQLACTISTAGPLIFGNYNPLLFVNHDAQTSMSVGCTGSGVRLLRVRLGPGIAGAVGARVMRRSGVDLPYGLYRDSARTVTWGDGTAGTSLNFALAYPGSNSTFQIYGRIPQRQNVPVGLYNDIVTVQVDW